MATPKITDLVLKGLWFDRGVWWVVLGSFRGISYAWENTCRETRVALQTARQS